MPHTTTPPRDTGTLVWGWVILLVTSGTSVAFNLRHALYGPTAGTLPAALAVMYGVMPVLVALALSHTVARRGGNPFEWAVGTLVFLTALTLSVSSIADVLTPFAGQTRGYAFAIMLDVAGLMGLRQVIGAAASGRGRHVRSDSDPVRTHPDVAAAGPDRTDVEQGGTPDVPGRDGTEPLTVRTTTDNHGQPRTGQDLTGPDAPHRPDVPSPDRPYQPVPLWPTPSPHPSPHPSPLTSPNGSAQVRGITDKQKLVAELVSEMRAAARDGRRWEPDYPALTSRTGKGKSACEKAVAAARRVVREGPDGEASREDTGEGDPDADPVRASG